MKERDVPKAQKAITKRSTTEKVAAIRDTCSLLDKATIVDHCAHKQPKSRSKITKILTHNRPDPQKIPTSLNPNSPPPKPAPKQENYQGNM